MADASELSDSIWPEVFSQAAHEIRTPLSVAAGYLRMILTEKFGPITDKQRHFLLEVEKATQRIHALTNEISELAKFDTEKSQFERAPVQIGALIRETIAALPPLEDGREIAVDFEDDAPEATVQGDRHRLLRAIKAIIHASRRELVGSDRLVVRLRRARSEAGALLRVNIAGDHRIDEVEGLPESELVRFNEKRGGCGLGPSIARRVVAAHDGRIWSTYDRSAAPPGGDIEEILKHQRGAETVLVLPERP